MVVVEKPAYCKMNDKYGYTGKRLSLTKIKEETDAEKIQAIRRRNLPCECEEGKIRFLVHFRIDGVRPLIGHE